jgi:hypothetical protein
LQAQESRAKHTATIDDNLEQIRLMMSEMK